MDNHTLLKEVLLGLHLDQPGAQQLFSALAAGEYSDVQIAALLATLHTRGEEAAEVAGAAAAFLQAAIPVPTNLESLDSAGTGGDRAGTINISTAAALVVASQGIRMAKHGNRSVSSKTGSADVLEHLGIPLDLSPEEAARALAEDNFVFLFAPRFHPAIARVMPVRRALGVPTLFNILGPLLNPAPLKGQLMGVAAAELAPLVADSLNQLGRKRALVVNGLGLDEVAVHGKTDVWEVRDGQIHTYSVTPYELGIDTYSLADLRGGEAAENANHLVKILSGQGCAAHNAAVAVNAGALAYLNGTVSTLREGTQWALDVLNDGHVIDYVHQLAKRSHHE